MVAGLERDIRGWTIRYRELKRDKEADARNDPLWPVALEHFNYWKQATGRKGCEWTVERFELIRPYLKRKKHRDYIGRAIDGIAYDHYVSTRRNGTKNHHNGWEVLFRDSGRFEEAVNASPRKDGPS